MKLEDGDCGWGKTLCKSRAPLWGGGGDVPFLRVTSSSNSCKASCPSLLFQSCFPRTPPSTPVEHGRLFSVKSNAVVSLSGKNLEVLLYPRTKVTVAVRLPPTLAFNCP